MVDPINPLIQNNRLEDGDKIENLPDDTQAELDLKEDLVNKENTTLDTSATKYPTNNLVKTELDGKVSSVVAGTNVTVDDTDPQNPIVSATATGGTGDVSGPASSTDNAISRFDGTDGKTIQDSDITIDDNGNVDNVSSIQFDITNTDIPVEGQLNWSDEAGTVQVGLPGSSVVNQLGQELLVPRKVKNTSGVDIKNGNLVYITGGSGVNAYIALASNDDHDTAVKTLAMATEDIDDNSFGYCVQFGLANGEVGQPIDTSGGTYGDILYLGLNGTFTTTKPTAPNAVVKIGQIFRPHAITGSILVNISYKPEETCREITKDPTGFTAPEDVIITGDSTTRTVTITGTVNAYYRGTPVTELISGYTSPAHSATTTAAYFLYYDGSTIDWYDSSSLAADFFVNVLIAVAFYDTTNATWVYVRECHGLMQWQGHRELHYTIGTYKQSGGTLADYTLESSTAADRRPSVSQTLIYDEDLPSSLPALPVDTYSNFYLSGTSGTPNFITGATDIVPLSGNQPYWNEFTGGTWQQTLVANGDYMNVYLLCLPMGADTNSQNLRFLWVQGQAEFDTLTEANNETTNDISLGTLDDLTPESVFVSKVTIRYIGGNWEIISVSDLTGTKLSQSQSPTGNYLSSVSSDTTLTGDGSSGSPLGVDLTNANTWSGVQTFTSSPLIPTPTTDLQAATKKYVDDNAGGGGAGVTTEIAVKEGSVTGITGEIGSISIDNAGTIAQLKIITSTSGSATLTVTFYKNGASIGAVSLLTSTTATNGWYQLKNDISDVAVVEGDIIKASVTSNTGNAWNDLHCSVLLA